VIADTTVRYRGWDFPHLNRKTQPDVGVSSLGSSDDFLGHLEYWRAFESGQFVYLSSVREWSEPNWAAQLRRVSSNRIDLPPGVNWDEVPGFIEVVNFVYTMVEFFEFSTRLAQTLPSVETVELNIGLNHIRGFVLTFDDFSRQIWNYYSTKEEALNHRWRLGLANLVSDTSGLTVEAIVWFLTRLGWLEPNAEQVRKDVESFRGGL
jgi:hypothetical protein